MGNWVEIVWIGMCAVNLALGAIHLFVWFKQRTGYFHLLFFALAVSATAFGAFELALMHEWAPERYADILRWAHVPLALWVLSMIGFVHFYFGAGRSWLAWAASGFRLAGLALNFLTGVNVNFLAVSSLEPVAFWGGAVVAGPVGVVNPWAIVPQIGNLILLMFVIDAAITLWRRGGSDARRRAVVVGGSLVACVAAVAGFAALITIGLVHAPTIVMPGVFVIVLAMGYELGWDMIAAAQLATQLRASEQRFRAVVEAVPSAILVVDDRGLISLANQQAETVFGYPRAELIRQPVELLIPERFHGRLSAWRTEWATGPHAQSIAPGRDRVGRRKNGVEFPAEVMLSPLQTEKGPFILASVVDVTERRRLEQATARQRDELAHLSRVALLGELSGSLAHELNQPLTAILSNAQAAQRFLAQSPPRTDKLAEILTDIVKANHRAGSVIVRLRSMLRKEESKRLVLNLNHVVEESLRLLRSDLLARHVTVQSDLAERLPSIEGDRNQLQQVLLNLLMNGCDAMEGQATDRCLTVRTQQTGQATVEVTVSDRGLGIPVADLDRVFDPFVTTKAQGLGLGLTICRSIVEAHGGRLWATNPAQGGATLHCELPATPG